LNVTTFDDLKNAGSFVSVYMMNVIVNLETRHSPNFLSSEIH
jgi:hypothetical protein